MRFMSVMLGLLCLPALMLALVLAPVIVPVLLIAAALVPGFASFRRTSGKRSWNLASYHSPHSLTWRWLAHLSVGSMFSRPGIFIEPRLSAHFGFESPFVGFGYNIGFGGAHAYTNNFGWQFSAWLLGLHLMFSQQRPIWYRDIYHRARDEADQLSGRLWVSDRHQHKVHVQPKPDIYAPTTAH